MCTGPNTSIAVFEKAGIPTAAIGFLRSFRHRTQFEVTVLAIVRIPMPI